MPKLKTDRSLLEAALVAFGHQLGDVTLAIADIKRMLGKGDGTGRRPKPSSDPSVPLHGAKIAAGQCRRSSRVKQQRQRSSLH